MKSANNHCSLFPKLLILLTLSYTLTEAQTSIEYNKSIQKDQGNLLLYDFAIKHSGNLVNVLLEFSILENSSILVYNAISQHFSLMPGLNILNYSEIQPLTIKTGDQNTPNQLKNGTYSYNIKIINYKTQEIITEYTEPAVVIVKPILQEPTEPQKKKAKITLSSNFRYSDQPYFGNEEEDKLQWQTNIGANYEFHDLPISTNLMVSNSTIPLESTLKKIQFSIDVKELQRRKKAKMINNIKTKIKQSTDSSKIKSLVPVKEVLINEKYPHINDLRAKVADYDPKQFANDKSTYKTINAILQSSSYVENKSKTEKVLKQYKLKSINEIKDSIIHLSKDSVLLMNKLIAFNKVNDSLENKQKIINEKLKDYNSKVESYKELKAIENTKLDNLVDKRSYKRLCDIYPDLNQNTSFIDGIESCTIGTFSPKLSSNYIQGIQVDGLEFSHISNDNIFKQVTLGHVRRSYDQYNTQLGSNHYNRMVYGIVLGLGEKESDHLHVHYIAIRDFPKNKYDGSTESSTLCPPAENFHLGVDYGLITLGQSLKIKFNINTSLFIPDQNSPSRDVQYPEILLIPFVKNRVKEGSTIGFSEILELQFVKEKNDFKASALVTHFSSGYRSLGIPLYYNNLSKYKIKLDKYYFKRRIGVSLFYQRESEPQTQINNLIYQINTNYGFALNIRLPRKPYFLIEYYPYFQHENGIVYDISPSKVTAYNHVICIQTGYESIRGTVNNNIFAYTYYQINNITGQGHNKFMQFTLSDIITYRKIGCIIKINTTPMNTNDLSYINQRSYSISLLFKPKFGSIEGGIIYNNQKDIGTYYSYKISSNFTIVRKVLFNLSLQYNEKSITVMNYESPKIQAFTSLFITL